MELKKPKIDRKLTEYIQKRYKEVEEQLSKCEFKTETKSGTVYFTPELITELTKRWK